MQRPPWAFLLRILDDIMATSKNAKILGTGSYLPKKMVSNNDLSKIVDTDDEWIFTRSGIRNRHIAEDGERTSDMALNAALNALEAANIQPSDFGGIIVATTTPDLTFPSTAAILQAKLGVETQCMAFDVQAVCSGFVYALAVANGFFKTGINKPILVVGAEKMSALMDWNDRTTCVLFGDGAGAVVLGATDDGADGILSTNIHADGRHCDLLRTTGGVTSTGEVGKCHAQCVKHWKTITLQPPILIGWYRIRPISALLRPQQKN